MSSRARVMLLAAEYAEQFQGLERFFNAYRPNICPFEALLDAVPNASEVFDIGCGTGLFLYILRAEGKLSKGIGVDIDEDRLSKGRGALGRVDATNIDLQCVLDFANWPSDHFDVVSMIDVLHHCPPAIQRTFFEAACDRVRPGGRLIYKDMCRSPLWMAWANRLHDLLMARQWIHYVPINDVEEWSAARGFRVIVAERINMYAYGHERVVLERKS
jgi:SAM-dependent methyltransferase